MMKNGAKEFESIGAKKGRRRGWLRMFRLQKKQNPLTETLAASSHKDAMPALTALSISAGVVHAPSRSNSREARPYVEPPSFSPSSPSYSLSSSCSGSFAIVEAIAPSAAAAAAAAAAS